MLLNQAVQGLHYFAGLPSPLNSAAPAEVLPTRLARASAGLPYTLTSSAPAEVIDITGVLSQSGPGHH